MNSTENFKNPQYTFYRNNENNNIPSSTQLKPFLFQDVSNSDFRTPQIYPFPNFQQYNIQNIIPKEKRMKSSCIPSQVEASSYQYTESFPQPFIYQNTENIPNNHNLTSNEYYSSLNNLSPVSEALCSPSLTNTLLQDIQKDLQKPQSNFEIKNLVQTILKCDVNNREQLKLLQLIDYILRKNENILNMNNTKMDKKMMNSLNQTQVSNIFKKNSEVIISSTLEESIDRNISNPNINRELMYHLSSSPPLLPLSSSSTLPSSSSSSVTLPSSISPSFSSTSFHSNITDKSMDELRKEQYFSLYRNDKNNLEQNNRHIFSNIINNFDITGDYNESISKSNLNNRKIYNSALFHTPLINSRESYNSNINNINDNNSKYYCSCSNNNKCIKCNQLIDNNSKYYCSCSNNDECINFNQLIDNNKINEKGKNVINHDKSFMNKSKIKEVNRKNALIEHQNIRNGYRSFNNGFYGRKPFKCKYCNNSFIRKYDLFRHTRLHTGEKPYVCKKCNMRFYRSDQLKIHEKSRQCQK